MARLKPATLLKLTILHGCFPLFLNCTNSTKSRNASHISNNEPELENDGNENGSNSDSDHEHIQDLDSDSNSKRILTYQRKVHSIDTTLEESNYTPMTLPEELKTIQGIAKGDKNMIKCMIQCMSFLIKKRSVTEGTSDEQIFWLENQAQLLQAKTAQQQSMCFISFLQMK